MKEMIEYEDFAKLDMRVVRIKEAVRMEGSQRLLRLTVETGEEERVVIAGIGDQYDPDELIGQKVIMLLNLKPKRIFGVESNGMILAADCGSVISLLKTDKDVKEGCLVR
ncbi:MAG: methionine--tRNA ligase subunit beta [Candidatus Micrarchaeia archaeon]